MFNAPVRHVEHSACAQGSSTAYDGAAGVGTRAQIVHVPGCAGAAGVGGEWAGGGIADGSKSDPEETGKEAGGGSEYGESDCVYAAEKVGESGCERECAAEKEREWLGECCCAS